MLSILKKGPSANKVPAEKVQATYGRYRIQALLSVFLGNDSNLLIVFYVQIMPDDLVMQLHRF